MAAITIRQLPDETKQQLRVRAAHHRRSMEAEAREILVAALRPGQPDQHWLDPFFEFGRVWGTEEVPIPPRDSVARYADFSGWPHADEARER